MKKVIYFIILLVPFFHDSTISVGLEAKGPWVKGSAKPARKSGDSFPYSRCFDHLNRTEYPDQDFEEKNGIINPRFHWPQGRIPYAFSIEITGEQKQVIRKGMQMLMDKTCIKFVERDAEANYVGIHAEVGYGCFSTGIGMRGGLQQVNLDPTGCMEAFIVAHEFIHVIGFWHEHTRHDRDDYIKVIWKNIQPFYRSQYWKKSTKYAGGFGYTYDYNSIMHYSSYNAVAIDSKKPTMVSKTGKPIPTNFDGLMKVTDIDAGKINAMYKNCIPDLDQA